MPILAEGPNDKKKPNDIKGVKEEEIVKQEKPLNLNGRNNGTQAHKIIKGLQRKQTGPREPQKRKY